MKKINFETIKKIVLSEQYNNTEMEIMAINGDTEGIANMLESKGYNRDSAGTIVQLLRSGMSEEEALNSIEKK